MQARFVAPSVPSVCCESAKCGDLAGAPAGDTDGDVVLDGLTVPPDHSVQTASVVPVVSFIRSTLCYNSVVLACVARSLRYPGGGMATALREAARKDADPPAGQRCPRQNLSPRPADSP